MPVVLFALLLSAGLGARASERLQGRFSRARYAREIVPVAAIAAFPSSTRGCCRGHSRRSRRASQLSVTLIFPRCFAMEMPFPLGIAALSHSADAQVPWAWGVNACELVVSAVLASRPMPGAANGVVQENGIGIAFWIAGVPGKAVIVKVNEPSAMVPGIRRLGISA